MYAFGTLEKRDSGARRRHVTPSRDKRRHGRTAWVELSYAQATCNSRRRQIDRAYAQLDLDRAERLASKPVRTDGRKPR